MQHTPNPYQRSERRRRTIITTIALLVLVGIGWFGTRKYVRHYSDGQKIHQNVHDANVRHVLWEPPLLLDGDFNANIDCYEPCFSGDGTKLYFTQGRVKDTNADLFVAHRTDEGWSDPQPLTGINTEYAELGPEISQDGKLLYFYSDRPGGHGGFDIWVSRRIDDKWSDPVNLGTHINSVFNEYGPALDAFTGVLYFASNRPDRELTDQERNGWKATLRQEFLGKDYDIYYAIPDFPAVDAAEQQPQANHAEDAAADDANEVVEIPTAPDTALADPSSVPVPVFFQAMREPVLSSDSNEGQVTITPTGDFIYFASDRPGGLGGTDLYRSRNFKGVLQAPRNLGEPANSAGHDMDPSLTTEGFTLVFSSNRDSADPLEYRIYSTVSRDVIPLNDFHAFGPFIGVLAKWWWALLLFVIAIVALYLLSKLWFGKRHLLSRMQRSVLASLLLHLLMAFILSTLIMTKQIIEELAEESIMEIAMDSEQLVQEKMALDIREKVTDLKTTPDQVLTPPAPSTMQIPTLEPINPSSEPIPDAFVVESRPVELTPPVPQQQMEQPPQLDTPDVRQLDNLQMSVESLTLETPDAQQQEDAPQPNAQPTPDSFAQNQPTPQSANTPVQQQSEPIPETLPKATTALQPLQPLPMPVEPLETLETAQSKPLRMQQPPTTEPQVQLDATRDVQQQANTQQVQQVTPEQLTARATPMQQQTQRPVTQPSQQLAEQPAQPNQSAVASATAQQQQTQERQIESFQNQPTPLNQMTAQADVQLDANRDVRQQAATKQVQAVTPQQLASAQQPTPTATAQRPTTQQTQVADQPVQPSQTSVQVDTAQPRQTPDASLSSFKNTPTPAEQLTAQASVQMERNTPSQAVAEAPTAKPVQSDSTSTAAARLQVDVTKPTTQPQTPIQPATQPSVTQAVAQATPTQQSPTDPQLDAFRNQPQALAQAASIRSEQTLEQSEPVKAATEAPQVASVQPRMSASQAASPTTEARPLQTQNAPQVQERTPQPQQTVAQANATPTEQSTPTMQAFTNTPQTLARHTPTQSNVRMESSTPTQAVAEAANVKTVTSDTQSTQVAQMQHTAQRPVTQSPSQVSESSNVTPKTAVAASAPAPTQSTATEQLPSVQSQAQAVATLPGAEATIQLDADRPVAATADAAEVQTLKSDASTAQAAAMQSSSQQARPQQTTSTQPSDSSPTQAASTVAAATPMRPTDTSQTLDTFQNQPASTAMASAPPTQPDLRLDATRPVQQQAAAAQVAAVQANEALAPSSRAVTSTPAGTPVTTTAQQVAESSPQPTATAVQAASASTHTPTPTQQLNAFKNQTLAVAGDIATPVDVTMSHTRNVQAQADAPTVQAVQSDIAASTVAMLSANASNAKPVEAVATQSVAEGVAPTRQSAVANAKAVESSQDRPVALDTFENKPQQTVASAINAPADVALDASRAVQQQAESATVAAVKANDALAPSTQVAASSAANRPAESNNSQTVQETARSSTSAVQVATAATSDSSSTVQQLDRFKSRLLADVGDIATETDVKLDQTRNVQAQAAAPSVQSLQSDAASAVVAAASTTTATNDKPVESAKTNVSASGAPANPQSAVANAAASQSQSDAAVAQLNAFQNSSSQLAGTVQAQADVTLDAARPVTATAAAPNIKTLNATDAGVMQAAANSTSNNSPASAAQATPVAIAASDAPARQAVQANPTTVSTSAGSTSKLDRFRNAVASLVGDIDADARQSATVEAARQVQAQAAAASVKAVASDSGSVTESSAAMNATSARPVAVAGTSAVSESKNVTSETAIGEVAVVQATSGTQESLKTFAAASKLSGEIEADVESALDTNRNVEQQVASTAVQRLGKDAGLPSVAELASILEQAAPTATATQHAVASNATPAARQAVSNVVAAKQASDDEATRAIATFANAATELDGQIADAPDVQVESKRDVTQAVASATVEAITQDATVATAQATVDGPEAASPATSKSTVVETAAAPKAASAAATIDGIAGLDREGIESDQPQLETATGTAEPLPQTLAANVPTALESDRPVGIEDALPNIKSVKTDQSAAQVVELAALRGTPDDLTLPTLAMHTLPDASTSAVNHLSDLSLAMPSLPEMTGPGDLVSRQIPNLDVGMEMRLESRVEDDSLYLLRDPKQRTKILERIGGNKDTEKAVSQALDWFSRNQEKDGRWSGSRHGGVANHDIAATSFAILCYYGWGAKHTESGPYQQIVSNGLDWLLKSMKPNGDLTNGQHNGMYDQGVATLALAEAYALTKDPKIRGPLLKALEFVMKAQSRSHGGWRYTARSHDGDTSVLGWQVMALRSAQMAGIEIPKTHFDLAKKWLDHVGGGRSKGLYGYQNRSPKPAMVATGMFCQQLMGLSPDHPRMVESAQYMQAHMPGRNPDFYYWYYGCLAMYQHQGPIWEKWNPKMRQALLAGQRTRGNDAGSWNPGGQHGKEMGRLVVTAMATLSLEVYYRYLPIYRVTEDVNASPE